MHMPKSISKIVAKRYTLVRSEVARVPFVFGTPQPRAQVADSSLPVLCSHAAKRAVPSRSQFSLNTSFRVSNVWWSHVFLNLSQEPSVTRVRP